MKDPIGALVTEMRTANIAGKRVRGKEPAGQSTGYEGDALAAGSYKRFVVLSRLGIGRLGRVPAMDARIGIRAYGVTAEDAANLAGEVSDFLNARGGRKVGSVWLYQSIDDGDWASGTDPATQQPYESGVITVMAATAAA